MIKINQWPLDFSKYHDVRKRTRYVADFEATTYYPTDDPKLNYVEAKNAIDHKEHHYQQTKHQAVNVWLWCIQPIEYKTVMDDNNVMHFQSLDTSNKVVTGYTIESFINYIKEHCKYADIYFHNGANYDSRFIWDYCTNHDFKTIKQGTSFGGHPNFIIGNYRKYSIWFDNQNVINFRDTRDMYKMGIRDMGNILKSMGYKHDGKGDTPIINNDDYVELEQKYPDHSWVKQAWITYCETDVRILHDFITLEHSIDTSVIPNTTAQLKQLKIDIKKIYPDDKIPLSFNYPPLVESGFATAAGLAYATMMNKGIPMKTYLNPYFKPIASPKAEKFVDNYDNNLRTIDHWTQTQKSFNETVIEPITWANTAERDKKLHQASIKHAGATIVDMPESAVIDYAQIFTDDEMKKLGADPNVVRPVTIVQGIKYTKKVTYTIYEAVWRDATTDEIVAQNDYEFDQGKVNYANTQTIDPNIDTYQMKTAKLNRELIKSNHVTTVDLPTDTQAISTKASHGSHLRMSEIDNDIKTTKSDTYAQRKQNRKIIEQYRQRVRFANDMAKRAYKGGITQTNFQHANKLLQNDDQSFLGMEFDVNSLYPSIYANVPYRLYNKKQFRDYAMPGDVVVKHFGRHDITKRRLQYYMNNIDKHPTFIKCSFIKGTVKPNRMPLIKPRTDDLANTMKQANGTADMREYYYYRICLFDQTFAMPDFKYFWDNYDFDYHKNLQVTDIYVFDRFTQLEEVMQQHEEHWKLIKEFAKAVTDNDGNTKLPGLVSYAKLMLNSCYGKMGNYDKSYNNQIILPENNTTKAHTLNKTTGGNNLAYVPAAAYITSYGRTFLAETVNKIGYDKFLYSDTDSIYVLAKDTPEAIKDYIDDTKIGYWAHEKSFTRFKAIKAKCYGYYGGAPKKPDTWKWHSVVAGFNKDSIKQNQFNVGTKSPVTRTTNTHGGALIMNTYQTIQPINSGYAKLSQQYFKSLK